MLISGPDSKAQTGPDFGNAAEPVLFGSLILRAETLRSGVNSFGADNNPELFVEGAIQLRAVVHRQNPESYREKGQPDLPDLDGSKSIRSEKFRLTSRDVIRAVLGANGIEEPRGYRLLWRGDANSLSKAFREVRGVAPAAPLSPVTVGNLDNSQRFTAAEAVDLQFSGSEGRTDRSLMETGYYEIRPGADGGPLRRESAMRQGFIFCRIYLTVPVDGENTAFNVFGLMRIERKLRTNLRADFGDDLRGKTYETGIIQGELTGTYDGP